MPAGRRAVVALLLALLSLFVFLPALAGDFLAFDDRAYVTGNPMVRQGLTAEGLRWSLTAAVAGNWHPVTLWSHMLDAEWYGPRPLGHHLTSVLLHALDAVLLFLVLLELTGAGGRAAAVAALWAVHPLRVESVAWIAERKDVLSALFFLLTLWAYARWARRGSRTWYAAALVAFALGLMTKPMLVTVPGVLLLLDVWPLGRWRPGEYAALWPRLWEKLPFCALAAASVWATLRFQAGALASAGRFAAPGRLANALMAIGEYVRATFWPRGLAALYPLPDTIDVGRAGLAAAFVLAVSAWVWRGRDTAPWRAVGWCWFLGMLVPVLGLVQVGAQAWADRYTYLPTIGLLLLLVWSLAETLARRLGGGGARLALGILLGIALLAEVAATRRQIPVWHDDLALWRRTAAVTPANYVAQVNLGAAELAAHDVAAAVGHYGEAVRLAPESMEARAGHGDALRLAGRPAEAAAELREAIRLRPADARPHLGLALALLDLGDRDAARGELERALELEPGFALAAHLLETLPASSR